MCQKTGCIRSTSAELNHEEEGWQKTDPVLIGST